MGKKNQASSGLREALGGLDLDEEVLLPPVTSQVTEDKVDEPVGTGPTNASAPRAAGNPFGDIDELE